MGNAKGKFGLEIKRDQLAGLAESLRNPKNPKEVTLPFVFDRPNDGGRLASDVFKSGRLESGRPVFRMFGGLASASDREKLSHHPLLGGWCMVLAENTDAAIGKAQHEVRKTVEAGGSGLAGQLQFDVPVFPLRGIHVPPPGLFDSSIDGFQTQVPWLMKQGLYGEFFRVARAQGLLGPALKESGLKSLASHSHLLQRSPVFLPQTSPLEIRSLTTAVPGVAAGDGAGATVVLIDKSFPKTQGDGVTFDEAFRGLLSGLQQDNDHASAARALVSCLAPNSGLAFIPGNVPLVSFSEQGNNNEGHVYNPAEAIRAAANMPTGGRRVVLVELEAQVGASLVPVDRLICVQAALTASAGGAAVVILPSGNGGVALDPPGYVQPRHVAVVAACDLGRSNVLASSSFGAGVACVAPGVGLPDEYDLPGGLPVGVTPSLMNSSAAAAIASAIAADVASAFSGEDWIGAVMTRLSGNPQILKRWMPDGTSSDVQVSVAA